MREVDRVATDDFGLALSSVMENAGRALAAHARKMERFGFRRVSDATCGRRRQ